ncbi:MULTISPECIES: metal-dependent hydrolase family protein [unclassified Cytobacillus]|uniref:metal-dependent hydrolase family protein n=1 Tax=unclassified Cytobacillus TaxID=2675268 RepID=UPI00135A6219|nr:amidohydrolase family protein [Cytobacillus sp. AMY 15.2]KAF0818502.1 aryldialkylphosphatase [Bacillus sp. ZZV12-4809]MCM3092594.1 amidohydrolase family protein [Cytobacillus sp. AMY 15.2]
MPTDTNWILKGGSIIDGQNDEVMENSYIKVENGRITEVQQGEPDDTEGFEVIDCTGKYILPGLIDCHVHLVWNGSADPQSVIKNEENDRIALEAYKHALDTLKLGVTTVRDLGAPDRTVLHVRNVIDSGLLSGPTIIASGAPICMTGGHVYYLGYESDGPDEVRKNTRRVLKEGADLVKVMATGGIYTKGEEPGSVQLTIEELSAAKEEALKKNKKVSAHADGIEGIMNCLEVGIDTIEHGIYADRQALEIMKNQGTFLVPTMAVMRQLISSPDIPAYALEKAKQVVGPHFSMLQEAVQIGVKIATGTDCGSPLTPPRYYYDELAIMHEAGMSEMEVIKASTSVAAECLGIEAQRGSISPGKFADLLISDSDPLNDLNSLRGDKLVMKNGVLVS